MVKNMKTKLVSVVFVALILCSVFAGAVSAGVISDDLCENTLLSETGRYDDFDASDRYSLSSEIDGFLDTNKPVFVFFYADWCHFCQEQKPIIDKLEQEYVGKIVFISVNAEENPHAVNRFGVTGFPAMFLIVDKDEAGYVYQGFNGFTEKETLKESFDYVLENGSLSEYFEDSCSSFQFNQTDFGNFSISIVSQANLTLDEFKAELESDLDFLDLCNYAGDRGFNKLGMPTRIITNDSVITTVTLFSTEEESQLFLSKYHSISRNKSKSILMNVTNASINIFDKDGGIILTNTRLSIYDKAGFSKVFNLTDGSVIEYTPASTHHSCTMTYWGEYARCIEGVYRDNSGLTEACKFAIEQTLNCRYAPGPHCIGLLKATIIVCGAGVIWCLNEAMDNPPKITNVRTVEIKKQKCVNKNEYGEWDSYKVYPTISDDRYPIDSPYPEDKTKFYRCYLVPKGQFWGTTWHIKGDYCETPDNQRDFDGNLHIKAIDCAGQIYEYFKFFSPHYIPLSHYRKIK